MLSAREGFSAIQYILFTLATLAVMLLCICVGSVNIPVSETLSALKSALFKTPLTGANGTIILSVRLLRVVCAAMMGAALSICGAAMQGLLKNPLADGTTLGVSSGASLGAVLALAFGFTIPGLPFLGTMVTAMVFACLSLFLILTLAYRLDHSLSTNTIILIGIVFSMFVNSVMSLVIAFSGERVKSIVFWSMGSLTYSNLSQCVALGAALVACAAVLLFHCRELNAFAIGEDNARHVGVNVKGVKLTVMIAVSTLIGVCVSISGTIGFVGMIVPHICRLIVGPNHKRLLPASAFFGAVFLLLADLAARTVLRPVELPIGVVTSLVGSVGFVYIFYRARRRM